MPNPKDEKPKGKYANSPYLKYSGMAFQMAAAILVFSLLGQWLDAQLETGQTMTIILALFGVFSGMYLALKDFL